MGKKVVSSGKVNLLVVPSDTYNTSLITFVKKVTPTKIGYVTINKGYSALVEMLRKNKFNLNNFIFVDCVTKSIITAKKEPNCVYISSPNALTEMTLAIDKLIDGSVPVILIDSLSTLLVYHSPNTITHFIHHIINKARNKCDVMLVMTISDKDKKKGVFKEIEVLVDKIVTI